MFSLTVCHFIIFFFESWSLIEHVARGKEQDPGRYSPATSPAGTIDLCLDLIWVVSCGPNLGPLANVARTLLIEPSHQP